LGQGSDAARDFAFFLDFHRLLINFSQRAIASANDYVIRGTDN
jgi:hypothetical protein